MKQKSYPQYFNVRIQYLYYDVFSYNEDIENVVHQIHYDKIMDCLEQKDFILRKEDIIFLLKDDGAHFFDDSLRVYEPTEDNYFQVPEDWEIEVDESEPEFALLFWIKSTNPSIKKKVDDVSSEVKSVRDTLKTFVSSFQKEMHTNFERYEKEIQNLRLSNQAVCHQLAIIHERLYQSSMLELGLTGKQSEHIAQTPNINPETGKEIEHISNYPLLLSVDRSKPRVIDIALMYSEPLVKRDDYGIFSLGDPVDYEEECNKLLELLKSKEKHIDVYFEIATIENLVNVISLSPKILHIICHGEYSKENNQFYLCFEEEGTLKELYSKDLNEKLAEIELKTQFVFVNACHSEEVAKVFSNAGVPCVIAVQSELKIEDHIAQKFSETFYWQLFEGKSVGEAFKLARIAVSGKDTYTCCCAHSHKPNCAWYKLAKEEGFEKAHYLHTPTCTSCKFTNKFYHNHDCNWALSFLFNCEIFDIPEGPIHACCCSPKLEHNEVMKFKLICSDEKFRNQPLFQDRERGKVSIKSYHSCVEQKYPVKRLTGRNKELYDMYEALTDKNKKFINLYGIEGVGKSSLVKQIANYLFERGFFKDKIAFITLDRTPSIIHFRSDLFKEVPGSYDLKSFCESIKMTRVMFILDKCDRLIKQDSEQFRHDLAYIAEFATNVKFVIITNEIISLKLFEVASICMRELKRIDAAKLLCNNAYAYLTWDQRNIYTLQEEGIFDLIPLTPQGIWSITGRLRHGKNLREIEDELAVEKAQDSGSLSNDHDEAIRCALQEQKALDETVYELLIFLCLFPSGLSYQDLEELEGQGRIFSDWKSILLAFLTGELITDDYEHSPGETPGISSTSIERSNFKPGNYIWMNIVKDPLNNEIYFVPAQFLIRYIENNLTEDSVEQNIKKLEYIALLSLATIEQIISLNEYNEKLVEFSSVSNYGIWKINKGKIFNIYEPKNKVYYLKDQFSDFATIKKYFQVHESNFLCCIDPKIVRDILDNDESKNDHIIEIIEILYIAVPTLFKLLLRGSEAIELARRATSVLEFVNEDPRLFSLEVKLNLFLTALYLESRIAPAENLPLVKVQLGLLVEQEDKIQDEVLRNAIDSEIDFARVIFLSREYKIYHRSKETAIQDIKKLLKSAKARLVDNRLFDPFKAKIALAEYKFKELFNQQEMEKELITEIESALGIFKVYGSQKLLMKAHYVYACLKFDLSQKKMKRKTVENTLEYTKEITQKLTIIKNEHLIRFALIIAKKVALIISYECLIMHRSKQKLTKLKSKIKSMKSIQRLDLDTSM